MFCPGISQFEREDKNCRTQILCIVEEYEIVGGCVNECVQVDGAITIANYIRCVWLGGEHSSACNRSQS